MTHLRKMMLEELERRNYAQTTTRSYIRTIEDFALYFRRPPDQLAPEHIREYQAYLFRERKLAASSVTQRVAALRFFYIQTIKKAWSVADTPYPKKTRHLPSILSPEEVAHLIDSSQSLFHRVVLMTLYGTGVRRAELTRLQIPDIDTDIRTAAAGALAARMLAPDSVRVAGILGTGVQAYWQARALFSVRKFKRLVIWGRNHEKTLALKQQLAPGLPGVELVDAESVREVVEAVQVLVTVTAAREPIVRGEWLRPGQHITAVGADDETKCELDAHCLKRANRLIVDSRDSARDHGEVHRWLKQGVLRMEDIHGELGEVLAGTVPGRRSSKEITIAKFVGIGVQDLAAAEVSIDKVKQAGQGLLSTIPTVR
jgi:ornithine cyclodeaminase/alanine dehydrogenase-like protein (mu-crystallin family)